MKVDKARNNPSVSLVCAKPQPQPCELSINILLSPFCSDPSIPTANSHTALQLHFPAPVSPSHSIPCLDHPHPTHHSSSFLIDHCWPVHGVLFPFAADTRGRVQSGRVSLDFCISYFHLHFHFSLFNVVLLPPC